MRWLPLALNLTMELCLRLKKKKKRSNGSIFKYWKWIIDFGEVSITKKILSWLLCKMPHHLCRQGSLKIIAYAPSPGGEWGLLAAWCRTWLIYSLRARTWWVSVNNHIRIWQRNGSSIKACLSMGTSDRRSLNQRWFILPWKPTAHTWVSLSVLSDSLRPHGLHAAWQAPPSVGFPRQEHWSGLPFPSPGDLPYPDIEPVSLASPALVGGLLTISKLP